MRVRSRILSVLNADRDFISGLSDHFNESPNNLRSVFDEIISSIIYTVNIQCVLNQRYEEICKIAKECSSVRYTATQLSSNSPLVLKGNGANSELFGNNLSSIVTIIASASGVKNSTVNRLFSVLTPVLLSDFYFNYRANNLSEAQLASYLEKINQGGKKLNADARAELASLIRDDDTRLVHNASHNLVQSFRHDSAGFIKKFFRTLFGNLTARAS